MKQSVPCNACKGGKRPLNYPEGGHLICPYCKDSGRREVDVPDITHKMSEWKTEVRCPADTPRFYAVRYCIRCGEEELKHPAGHFSGNLLKPCGIKEKQLLQGDKEVITDG